MVISEYIIWIDRLKMSRREINWNELYKLLKRGTKEELKETVEKHLEIHDDLVDLMGEIDDYGGYDKHIEYSKEAKKDLDNKVKKYYEKLHEFKQSSYLLEYIFGWELEEIVDILEISLDYDDFTVDR